jgi:hypothetical protein
MKDLNDFEDELARSEQAVARVEAWLSGAGFKIDRPETLYPKFDGDKSGTDNGDLLLEMVFQVKFSHYGFTEANDFPYRMVLVDEVYKFDKLRPRVLGYALVDDQMRAACLINAYQTFEKWDRYMWYSEEEQRECEFYRCPKDLCRWVTFHAAPRRAYAANGDAGVQWGASGGAGGRT